MGAVAQGRQRIAVHYRRRRRAVVLPPMAGFSAVSPAAVNGKSAAVPPAEAAFAAVTDGATARRQTSRAR